MVNNLSDIVDNGLCIGCGLCQSIAGKDKIEVSMSPKGRLEPKEVTKISPEIFDKILKVCPGVIVEGLPKEQVDTNTSHNLVWGYYLSLCYAWSTDEKVRFESSTGGLLNGLSIYLLESKKVKFILHTAADPKKPMRSLSKISYNKEELVGGESRSRYGPAAPLDKFHEALDLNQPFAFVGKPCDISAIRLLSKTDSRVNKLCKYLLTLVCGGFAEFTKAQDFIESFKVKEDELSIFRYRGFGNPGRMYIKTKDGREYDREYNSFWGEESTWRVPFRCKICPDAIGESADVAALDTWRGGSPKGEDEGFNAAIVRTKKGLDFVIIEVKDWKIIPLENIIAKLHKIHTKIFSIARNAKEARKMFSILDVGVDGVIFNTGSMNEVRQALVYLGSKSFELSSAKIIDIQEVGDGERVCVDTASMLNRGEGMLIGSRANFLFLVHNESVGSSFTSPRPFRVNAGAVHCYTLAPDGTTKYLSELETGVEILVLDSKGKARRAAIGRCKIEKRPMLMIKAKVGDEIGGIIAQDAETIRFVKPNGQLVSVTHLKKGDSVIVHSKAATGRHFGMEVSDEYILEK